MWPGRWFCAPTWDKVAPMRGAWVLLLMGLPLAGFCQGKELPRLQLRDAMVTEMQRGGSAAISAEVVKPSSVSLTIVAAGSPMADQVLLQAYSTSAAGVRKVEVLQQLVVPAKGSVMLEPGKTELRLIGLKEDL